MTDRKDILVVHSKFDWSKIDGHTINDAIKYLQGFSKSVPADAIIDENWTGYEDMEMRVISWRRETDEEYADRKGREEYLRALREQKEKNDVQREKRRAEYLRLKEEFG